MAEINNPQHQKQVEDDEIELTLGLSLNGKFGFDPNSNKLTNLRRSYSISNFIGNPDPSLVEKTGGSGFPWVGYGGLGRTCSLPVEAEEESRKRKEVQVVRYREAKRTRVEEIGNGSGFDGKGSEGVWISPTPISRGFSGSGSGSEFDSQSNTRSFSGTNRSTEAKSPQSVQSLDKNEPKNDPPKLQNDMQRSFSGTGEMLKNMLANMPCVSTKGDRPNGKQIEGFLYRYKKGEEVRIVCVCHGSFLTPAEFVKHAGCKNVEHPLRRIVVNSSSFL